MNLWPSASRLEQALQTAQKMRRRVDASTMKFLNFFTPRRTGWMASGLLVAFFLVSALHANALTSAELADGGDKMASWVFIVLNNILLAIVQTVGQLASIVVSLLVAISSFNKFSTVRVVDIGWTIVKDVSNMLFIIALLVIAAGTVLRLENYKYNRLLSNLIIMAFLTNFSRFIAAFFIQGAQVLMLTFANAYKDALYGNFVSGFGLDQVLRFRPDAETMTQMSVFSNLLAGLVLTVIALIITAAICVVLFARIVALWILVILSPFAFASQILPNTKSFSTRWWSEFGKYVTQGPILAFFLWLALAVVSVGSGATAVDPDLGTIAADLQARQGASNFFQIAAFTFDNLMTFVISGAFLVFGLNYATSSSGAAGKWAGKVASVGFAGAATVSGINAIRDRTIAPVQGWIKNRGAARNTAIQERTQTLEAAGDRVRARIGDQSVAIPFTGGRVRIGPGRAGAEKSQADANAYERQRTQRFAQGRGLNDDTEQQLQTRMQNSTDRRERLAALTELQNRGRLNLRDPLQDGAFTQIMAQNRIPPADVRKLRQEALKANVGAMEEAEVRARLAATADQDEQIILAKDLERRKALNHENTADVGIINQLRANLNGIPQQLKEFDDALQRSNPKMALETIYNGLRNGTADGQRLVAAMQQGLIDGAGLDAPTLATFHQALVEERVAAGDARPAAEQFAESYLLQNISSNARTKADFDRIMNSFTNDTKRIIRSNAVLEADTNSEKRSWVADTGAIEEAYTQINPAGNRELMEGLRDQYYQLNSHKIADNFEAQNMTDNTIKNDTTRSKIIALDEVDGDSILKATKGDYARKIFSEAQSVYVEGLDKSQDGWNNSSALGKANNKQRTALGLSARGGKVHNAAGQEVESLEQAWSMSAAERFAEGEDAFNESQKMMARFVRTEGKNLGKMNFSALATGTKEIVVDNMNVRSLAAIHDKNPNTTLDIVHEIRLKEAATPAGTPEKKRWEKFVEKIDRDDALAGLGT